MLYFLLIINSNITVSPTVSEIGCGKFSVENAHFSHPLHSTPNVLLALDCWNSACPLWHKANYSCKSLSYDLPFSHNTSYYVTSFFHCYVCPDSLLTSCHVKVYSYVIIIIIIIIRYRRRWRRRQTDRRHIVPYIQRSCSASKINERSVILKRCTQWSSKSDDKWGST